MSNFFAIEGATFSSGGTACGGQRKVNIANPSTELLSISSGAESVKLSFVYSSTNNYGPLLILNVNINFEGKFNVYYFHDLLLSI